MFYIFKFSYSSKSCKSQGSCPKVSDNRLDHSASSFVQLMHLMTQYMTLIFILKLYRMLNSKNTKKWGIVFDYTMEKGNKILELTKYLYFILIMNPGATLNSYRPVASISSNGGNNKHATFLVS